MSDISTYRYRCECGFIGMYDETKKHHEATGHRGSVPVVSTYRYQCLQCDFNGTMASESLRHFAETGHHTAPRYMDPLIGNEAPAAPAGEREQFEKWVKTCDGEFVELRLDSRDQNAYADPFIQHSWGAWQAARASAVEQRVKEWQQQNWQNRRRADAAEASLKDTRKWVLELTNSIVDALHLEQAGDDEWMIPAEPEPIGPFGLTDVVREYIDFSEKCEARKLKAAELSLEKMREREELAREAINDATLSYQAFYYAICWATLAPPSGGEKEK